MTAPWDGRGLPPVARARIERAGRGGPVTSLLSVASAAATGSAGLLPVGEVMGCCVTHLGWNGWSGCGVYGGGFGGAGYGGGGFGAFGGGGYGGSGAGRFGIVAGFTPYVSAVRGGYATALTRLETEARALGAHGVIGVRLGVTRMESDNHEFVAIGTAVRFAGADHPGARLFVTDLPGVDVTKLLDAGWLPAAVLVGLSLAVRHDDWSTRQQSSWGAGNTEVTGLSELTTYVRDQGRDSLARQADGADGVLVTGQQLNVWEQEPAENHRDHLAEMRMFGTSLLRLAHRPGRVAPTTLTVLPLRDASRRL